MSDDNSDGRGVIERAVSILLCFDAMHPELGVSEISRRTGLSTSTVHRQLVMMHKARLVRQTPDRQYGLGPLLMQLARNGALPTTLRDAALPLMTALRDEVNETVALHELNSSGQRVVVEQVESHQPLSRRYTDIGVPIALPLGASGKAILASMPVEQLSRWREQQPAAARDVSHDEELTAELAEARARGWAVSSGERTPGLKAVAAPVLDATGDVVGALGISAPLVRMDDDRTTELGERVKAVAWQASELLGAATPAFGQ